MKNKLRSVSDTGRILVPILLLLITTVYWITAYRTIGWWDAADYPLVAVVCGVSNPPGSLLLTLIGWLISRIPIGISDILALNLFAGVMASVTICLVWLTSTRLWKMIESSNKRPERSPFVIGSAILLGCLTLACSLSIWRFAVKFTPYIMTTVFTALILLSMLRWFKSAKQKQSWNWLFIAALLIGLDFSVHRTNSLLVPGIAVWILLADPRTFIRFRSWLAGLGGLLLGLSFHLLIIPLAAAKPVINMGDPSNWSRFYDYITLKQYGGHWLVNLYPRKGDFIDIQIADYVSDFIANFANVSGPFGYVGLLPVLLGLFGLFMLIRRNWRLGVGILSLFLSTSFVAVVYFNLPEDFFRPMDRHYMPSFVIFGVFVCFGMAYAAKLVSSAQRPHRKLTAIILLALIAAAPLSHLFTNYHKADGSRRSHAHDYASNILNTVEQDAILFITGDVFWPVMYLHQAAAVRDDITVVSTSLFNTPWYVRQVVETDGNFPLTMSSEEIDSLRPTAWTDSTLAIAIDAGREAFALSDSLPWPDSALMTLPPTLAGHYVLPADKLIFDMITENEWRRPIYFNVPPEWLASHVRLEGLVYRLIPIDSVTTNNELLSDFLGDKFLYNGWDLDTDYYDPATKTYAGQLKQAWLRLAHSYLAAGDSAAACSTINGMTARIPNHEIAGDDNLNNLQKVIMTRAGCGD